MNHADRLSTYADWLDEQGIRADDRGLLFPDPPADPRRRRRALRHACKLACHSGRWSRWAKVDILVACEPGRGWGGVYAVAKRMQMSEKTATNYRWVGRIPRSLRVPSVSFSVHMELARFASRPHVLEPMLRRAALEGWTVEDARRQRDAADFLMRVDDASLTRAFTDERSIEDQLADEGIDPSGEIVDPGRQERWPTVVDFPRRYPGQAELESELHSGDMAFAAIQWFIERAPDELILLALASRGQGQGQGQGRPTKASRPGA